MKLNKKVWASAGVLGATALTTVTILTSHTLAADTSKATLPQRLASKLNLDQSKVDSAFGSIEQENFTNRQTAEQTKLDQAVKDGIITADQETKILDKQKELYTEHQKQRTDLEQWISDNNIDATKLRQYGIGIEGFGARGGHMGGGMMQGWK